MFSGLKLWVLVMQTMDVGSEETGWKSVAQRGLYSVLLIVLVAAEWTQVRSWTIPVRPHPLTNNTFSILSSFRVHSAFNWLYHILSGAQTFKTPTHWYHLVQKIAISDWLHRTGFLYKSIFKSRIYLSEAYSERDSWSRWIESQIL